MKGWARLLLSILGCELVGLLSTPFTISAIPTWYAGLILPPFAPPNWIFGPVWTILYAMMGIALYQIWNKPKSHPAKSAFSLQLSLNFFWSVLFFGLHAPLLALTEIIVLWILIVVTLHRIYPLSKWAYYLLIPYLLWVSFAMLLNASIVVLN